MQLKGSWRLSFYDKRTRREVCQPLALTLTIALTCPSPLRTLLVCVYVCVLVQVSAQQFDPSRCSLAVNCPALPLPLPIPLHVGPGPGPGASGLGGGLVPLVVDAQGNFKVAEAAARVG